MDGPHQIEEVTRNFCQKVIENTIESLRSQINTNEIPDDQLDRLKSQWEQRWQSNLQRLDEEAKEKANTRDILVN